MRHLIPIALCALQAVSAQAQLLPEQRFLYPATTEGLAVVDVDGDGDRDVVRSAAGRLFVMVQDSPGVFYTQLDLGTCAAYEIRMGDADGDGLADIVAGDGNRIRWAKGLGGGAYALLQDLVTGTPNPFDIHLIDLDGDGDLDLLHADVSTTTNFRWNANNGSGVFGPSALILSAPGLVTAAWLKNHVAVGDIDQDGDIDFTVCRPMQAWWSNDGAGNFTEQLLPQAVGEAEPLLTDLDGDGDLDLVLGINTNNSPTIMAARFNQGGGAFGGLQTLYTLGGTDSYLAGAQDADTDGDGDRDLVIPFSSGIGLTAVSRLLINDGLGSFGTSPYYFFESEDMHTIGIGDLDNDGMDDIVSSTNDGLYVRYSDNGSLQLLTSVPSPARVFALDIDGDLDQDVLLLSPTLMSPLDEGGPPLQAVLHLNLGNGVVADAAQPVWTSVNALWDATVGDLDGDGDPDLAALWGEALTGTTQKPISFINNAGSLDSTFATSTQYYVTPVGSFAPWLGDLDLDGDLDLMHTGLMPTTATTLMNQGSGTFGTPQNWSLGPPYVLWSTLCDVDADGDADIVWTDGYVGDLHWKANDGLGAFGPDQLLSTSPAHMVTEPMEWFRGHVLQGVDLTNDGWEDLVVFTGDSIGLMLNNAGTWTMGQQFVANAMSYAVGDIDNSGSPDLVAIRSNREVVAWLNMGLGIFAPELLLADQAINSGTDHIALADMDNDGLTDVITCSANGHSAAWMRNGGNIGTGLFPAPSNAPALHVFPVPMHDRLQVNSALPITAAHVITVLDAQGRTLRTLRGNGTNTILLDRGDLAPGLYVVRITDHGAARFVVE